MNKTPSTQTLLKASSAAILIAGITLLTIILPAEYNIDPTGMGKQLGLTVLAQAPPKPMTEKNIDINGLAYRDDVTTIEVPANGGIEYKFYLPQYGTLKYEWFSDAAMHFEFHGEPQDDTSGYFETYTLAISDEMEGAMTVPFGGSHGWYWKNTSDEMITVTLTTEGNYRVIGVPL
jgi:hypothetical protein